QRGDVVIHPELALHFLTGLVTLSFALFTELVKFAARSRLDYVASLVTESKSFCPPSVEGEPALSSDVLEDRQFELECLATALPRFASMLLCLEGDPDALDIPTPRSYAARSRCDYELHSLDLSTAFLQGSLHEEIWLRRPPGFTGSFPAGTQWSLRGPVYGLRQAHREWHDTLRTTLAALGFAPSSADPSLFLRTDNTLPPFYALVYVDDLVFAIADTEALALVKAKVQKRHICIDLGELRSYLGLHITRDRARRTITLPQLYMVHQSVEPSGPYLELVGCLMYLMTCTRPDLAYPLSLLARYVAPGRHRKELRWLTYLVSDLGERPRSPPVLYCPRAVLPVTPSCCLRAPLLIMRHPDLPAMATLSVLTFDHEGRPIQFDTWLDDLQLYLLRDSRDSISLFHHTSGASLAPPDTADSATCSQWLTHDAASRLAVRNHLPLAEHAHFGQYKTAKALYDDVVARYSSPATAALGRLLLTYLFLELPAFATVEDLITHLPELACGFSGLHEEIRLRRLPGFTGSFPAGIQWSLRRPVYGLRRPVYGLRQAPREWHDTLRTTLAALGFAPLTADPSLFLRTDNSLPPFYILMYVLQRFGFRYSLPQSTPLPTGHSLSAPPSDESVEPSGPCPKLVGCLMYLMSCTRPDLPYPLSILARYYIGHGARAWRMGPVVLTGHADASWVDDLATQRSSQGYTFSLGSGYVSWRCTRLSSVLSSSCEAGIYTGAMAAQELHWLTYLLTDLGEWPHSPPVLYVDNKTMTALCQEHILEHRTKHIALRYFLARELQQCGQLRLAYVATRANTVNGRLLLPNIHAMAFLCRLQAMVSPSRTEPPFPLESLPDDVLELVLRALAETLFRHAALVSKRWLCLATAALSHLTIQHLGFMRTPEMKERNPERFHSPRLSWLPLPRLLSALRRFPALTHVSLCEISILSADGDALFNCLAATYP
ncbi:unnamed protein product, partial [Closterium sp. NIES-53]